MSQRAAGQKAIARKGKGAAVDAASPGAAELRRLPTLQRNALRKVFDRNVFTPEEVVALGYRRLQQAEGIGQKGLETIIAWLQEYGLQLSVPAPANDDADKPLSRHTQKSLEAAIRVLRAHGYVISRRDKGVSQLE